MRIPKVRVGVGVDLSYIVLNISEHSELIFTKFWQFVDIFIKVRKDMSFVAPKDIAIVTN